MSPHDEKKMAAMTEETNADDSGEIVVKDSRDKTTDQCADNLSTSSSENDCNSENKSFAENKTELVTESGPYDLSDHDGSYSFGVVNNSDVDTTIDSGTTQFSLGLSQRFASFRSRLAHRRSIAGNSATLAEEAAAAQAAKEEKGRQQSPVEMELQKAQDSDYEYLRASQISVTVIKEERETYGFRLAQASEQESSLKIDVLVEDGLLYQSPLKVGDTLKAVNNKKVTQYSEVMEQLVKIEGAVTIVAQTPQGNPSVVQAFCRKPTKETLVGIGFHTLEQGGQKLLMINHLDSNGLLAYSTLSQGDLVLAINETPCANKTPKEAASIILDSPSIVSIVALSPRLANQHQGGLGSRAQRWMRGAKRAGIALGGGTMVGVGLVFIPTLPPPFGEVLILGGVSVLGTEFEAPKRVVKSARDSLERAVGRNEDTAEANTGNKNTSEVEVTGFNRETGNEPSASQECLGNGGEHERDVARINDCWDQDQEQCGDQQSEEGSISVTASVLPAGTNDHAQPKRNMKDRMKSFGRNYVLPFLDQVVGDRKVEEKSTSETEAGYSEATRLQSGEAQITESYDFGEKIETNICSGQEETRDADEYIQEIGF